MMQSSLIGKVEKARRYALEKNRISFSTFTASFKGEHDSYSVAYDQGKWRCTCHSFTQFGLCSHIMALQKILEGMIPVEESVSIV